jgi:hypothetical protein
MGAILKSLILVLFVFATTMTGTVVLADQKDASFGYDLDGRLMTGRYEGPRCLVYGYDLAGNRTSQATYDVTANVPRWGTSTWNGFDWASGALTPTWGSGTWGCLVWAAE